MSGISRRDFLKTTVLAAGMLPLPHVGFTRFIETTDNQLSINLFSKHLHFLNYRDMAAAALETGFDGIDLTVRPGGHVLPEHVEQDLPKAHQIIRDTDLELSMITTAVEDTARDEDRNVLSTAAELGIQYYRMNWYTYPENRSMPQTLDKLQQKVKKLSNLNADLGIIGCYQNHAGKLVGTSLWEIRKLLEEANQQFMGVQYDIRHATVEGAKSWENGLRLIHPHIKTIVLKDVKWEVVNGEWKLKNTPIGEGMVDFDSYFKLLKKYQINVPVSLHMEYPLGGAEHGAHDISIPHQQVFDAMKKDLQTIRSIWASA